MMKAWFFTGETFEIGEWTQYKESLEPNTLYASKKPSQALIHANGSFLHYAECDGKIIEEEDRFTCTRRRIIKTKDVGSILRRYAKDQALKVIGQWDAPQVVKEYLENNHEPLRDPAWSASWDCHSGSQAIWSKEASLVAWYAAGATVWYAARSAAKMAANVLCQDTSEEFDNIIYKLFELKM